MLRGKTAGRRVGILERAGAALLLTVLSVCAGGCSASYHLKTDVLDDGSVIHQVAGNEIQVEGAAKYHDAVEMGNYRRERRCVMDVRKTEDKAGNVSYELLVTYIGVDWLDIVAGRSLELFVDQNSFVLSGEGAVRREKDPTGKFVTESLDYPVSKDLLLRLADAKEINVVLTGREGSLKGYFDEKNFATIYHFVNDHVRKEAGVSSKT